MILAAAWYHTILAFLFTVVAVLIILVILLQRGRGVGLSGAFGGAGGTSAFGAKTGDVLTWVTIVGAAVLLTFAAVLNYVFVESPAPVLQAPAAPPSSDLPSPAPGAPGMPVSPTPVGPGGPAAPVSATPTPAPIPMPTPSPAPPPPTPAPTQTPATPPGSWHALDPALQPVFASLRIFAVEDA